MPSFLRRGPAAPLHRPALAAARRRRAAGAACAALALVGALLLIRPPPAATAEVLVAARDLNALAPLSGADFATRSQERGTVPDGALPPTAPPRGASLSAPMRKGEVFTGARIAEPLTAGYGAALVAAPVRIADRGTAALLRPGTRVDVIAAAQDPLAAEVDADSAATAEVVAADRPVVALPREQAGEGEPGALIVIAATREEARRLAIGTLAGRLSVTIRG
ncbi:Flp pilus assembly protein CpaB [Murinocardiopsis flavida]|uniref:Flp pilus assembly protein CpaB n=1 Tax=Murinocardiopsis flavida TaxID=645275 RepID=A0A2P8DMH0_9ACTN|nr:SAF domain-containing protein [Murinocardiopsis flavida]PSK98404.1 Flp pilus assembly protein CpaB [Murinocardiopsis flavida]